MQYAVGVSAKRSTHTVDLANMVVGTITFSAIRSNPHSWVRSRYTVCSRYAVCSRCQCKKVNSHSGLSKYWWWGPLPLVQKGHCTPHAVDTVGVQCAVDVTAKRSIHTVDLANMGGGDRYL